MLLEDCCHIDIAITGQSKQTVITEIQEILITINRFDCPNLDSEIPLNDD